MPNMDDLGVAGVSPHQQVYALNRVVPLPRSPKEVRAVWSVIEQVMQEGLGPDCCA